MEAFLATFIYPLTVGGIVDAFQGLFAQPSFLEKLGGVIGTITDVFNALAPLFEKIGSIL